MCTQYTKSTYNRSSFSLCYKYICANSFTVAEKYSIPTLNRNGTHELDIKYNIQYCPSSLLEINFSRNNLYINHILVLPAASADFTVILGRRTVEKFDGNEVFEMRDSCFSLNSISSG